MSEDRRTAQILGVDVPRMNSLVFGTATALAALAGALMGPVYLVGPTVGVDALLRGYVLIAIGGMGSIPGTVVGGMLLGIVESFGSVFIAPAYKTVYGFLLMLAFLMVKPTGLFGWQE
jgi:branched-chain amino acid transport system permease protein